MKIAIAVHGRFHAFDLAKALIERGHDITIFTNYPKWAVKRFGISPRNIRSFTIHGVLSRINLWMNRMLRVPYAESFLHKLFGRWARDEIAKENWDIVHCWSGVSEELLPYLKEKRVPSLLMRGSSHIRVQHRLLEEEEARTGISLDKPSRLMIEREEREYELADYIVVLSTFCMKSFLEEGVSKNELILLPLGVSYSDFRPSPEMVETRFKRILSGEYLRVIFVGAVSLRKGMWDMLEIINSFTDQQIRFRFVGPVTPEVRNILPKIENSAEVISKQPHKELKYWYEWADVFIFPTIEDGFAVVLTQAQISGLPIITTTNCSGPDIIREGIDGWVLPIRSPEAFKERLQWCDSHRVELADMVKRIYYDGSTRTWNDVASDFEKICISDLHLKN